MNCKICSHQVSPFAIAKVLARYEVRYYQCRVCGFVQTEDPYWLEEAFASAINESDLGLIGRNIVDSKISRVLIPTFFKKGAKFVDYGGGYGLYVRMMRDFGFDFYHFDSHCVNLFAKGFDADTKGDMQYELVTAFEVFEHLVHPLDDIERMLQLSRNIFFSTILIPPHNPKPEEWWYYGLDHGQHVAFYTQNALAAIGKKFGLNLYSNGRSLHLLTEKRISSSLFKMVSRYKVDALLGVVLKQRSLLEDDYRRLTGRPLH